MIRRKDCSNRGKLMLLVGVLTALPLLILPFYPEDGCFWRSFLIPTLVSLTVGGALCLFGKGECSDSADRSANQRSSTKTVLFAWSWGILIGAMPFFLSGQLTAMQSLFESVSGWTTTGLSVMNVTETSHIFLFYRSLMQYCGGVGFILMMVMMVSDKRSMELFSAEGHPDMLMPNLKRTARTIFEMYLIFLAIGTAAYALCGMPVFDSLCHAMCSLSTGGFSTRLNSIGEYHSLAVEAVTIVLMLVGTTNFAVLLLLVQGKWKRVFRVSEVRFLFLILLIFVPMVTIFLCRDMHMGFGESLRHALFNTASALSTTGYATMGYETWPPFAVGVLILLMLIGGGMGSTAGGLKLTRVYLILRMIGQNIKKRVLPQRCVEIPTYVKAQGKTKIDEELCSDTVGFVGSYLLLFVAGTLLLTLTAGCSLTQAMFEFASALGTVGLSIGITGPAANPATLIVEIFGMILGRLEIFLVVTGIYFWIHKAQ